MYINLTNRDVRRTIAVFRMNRFAWETMKNRSGERICVLCNGIETVEHLIDEGYGTVGTERGDLYSRGLNNNKLVLDT